MKTLKRAFSLFVALVMCLSVMSLPAFAEAIDELAQDVAESISDEPSTDPVTEDEAAPAETGETGEDATEPTEETTEATDGETTEPTEETEATDGETTEVTDGETTEAETPEETAETPAEDAAEEPAEEEPAAEEPAEEEPTEEIVEEPEAKPAEEIVEELPAPVEQPVLTEEELAAQAEAERLAAEEAARLEAERLAAEEAARLEAERLAALEAARLAALERRWPKADCETVRTAGSYTVTVNVPEGAFPMEVSLTVSAVEWSALDEETRALLYAEGLTEADALLDICFIDEDGNEREPEAAIGVTIEAAETEIAEVYHVEDEETVAKVAEEVETVAEFKVGSFSLFVISTSTSKAVNADYFIFCGETNLTEKANQSYSLEASSTQLTLKKRTVTGQYPWNKVTTYNSVTENVSWSTEGNTNLLQVDSTGKVTVVGTETGECVVTATVSAGDTAISVSCTLKVEERTTPIAKVGETVYYAVGDAIAAWGPGKTLTLLDNVVYNQTVTVEVNATKSTQNWTLDLGDYTWTANGYNAFQLYAAGGTVMAQNYGLKVYANQSGGITASGKYAIEVKYDNSKAGYRPRLEIHGGTYNASYVVYYYDSSSNNSNITNGPSTWFYKSKDGSEPVFNGNFGLYKCPINLYAGYFNGTSFNTYPVNSTANTNLYGGHFKNESALPSASNNKGIHWGNYVLKIEEDGSYHVLSTVPSDYEGRTSKKTGYRYTAQDNSYNQLGELSAIYWADANMAISNFSSLYTKTVTLSADVTASQDFSVSSGTYTIDASAEGASYTGTVTLTGKDATFVVSGPKTETVLCDVSKMRLTSSVDAAGVRTYSLEVVPETAPVQVQNADKNIAGYYLEINTALKSANADQTVVVVTDKSTYSYVTSQNSNNVSLSLGTNKVSYSYYAVYSSTSGYSMTVLDGTYQSSSSSTSRGTVYAYSGTVTIKGGTFTNTNSGGNAIYVYNNSGAVLNITGGTFIGKISKGANGKLNITGGTFSVDPSAYVAAGYTAIRSDAEGNYSAKGAYWTVVPEYTVTWVIEGRENATTKVAQGMTPVYDGETPTKAEDAGYTYALEGWSNGTTTYAADAALPAVSGDVTYTAVFNSTAKQYTVKFVSDGAVLSSTSYNYNTAVGSITVPANPAKAADARYTYAFKGWTPEIAPVTADVTYTAVFEATPVSGTPAANTTIEVSTTTTPVDGGEKVTDTMKTTVVANDTTTVTTTETETTTTTTESEDTTTYQVATTTTTKEKVGEDAETTTGTVSTTQKVNLKSAAQETGTKVSTELPESTVKETVTEAANKANNAIAVAQVNVAKIAKAELDKVEDAENRNVTVDVALTLKTTLDNYATATDETTNEVKVASVTYDVTPYKTVTVKVNDVQQGAAETTPVSNEDLATSNGAKITFKLPVPDSFVPTGTTQLTVRHIHDDGTSEPITGTIGGSAGSYYVEVSVTEFSKFEVLPAGSSFYTVSFDSNGGSAVTEQVIASGATATRPSNPTRSGYGFNGWTLNGSAYNFASAVTGNITLVASWAEYSSNDSSSDDDSSGSTAPQTTTIVDETTPLSEFPIFYVDVADGSWYHDAIAYVTALELMNGVGDNHFAPDDNTTRGMVAVVMMRLASGEAVDLTSFFDVADSAYYAEAAAWAVENGVFKGYDDGSFRGEINITREQFAAVLYRYALAKGYDVSAKADLGTYDDGALVGGYASDAMAWAIANGVIKGVGNNRLDPLGNATRAQLATMLMRFNELTKDVV